MLSAKNQSIEVVWEATDVFVRVFDTIQGAEVSSPFALEIHSTSCSVQAD